MRAPADYLAERIEAGDIPSASWLIGDAERVIASGALGHAVLVPGRVPAAEDTIYDLASLTKPLVTSLLVILLAREAGFRLGDRAGRFLPEFDRLDKRDITLAHLLTHTSGLPDWAPLYVKGGTIAEYLRQIQGMQPLEPPGVKLRYSDPGYIALGAVAERAGTAGLGALAASLILEPVGSRACFRPPPALQGRVAATEEACQYERVKAGAAATGYRGWREGVIRGEVHDQNAWAAGGVAGHAGLFGTAKDVYLIARKALDTPSRLVAEEDLPLLREARTGDLPEPRSMAYRINRAEDGGSDPTTAAGAALPPRAFGHNGFTGTSVWIDPAASRVYVLLTNRVHPEVREEMDMNALRREFHRLAATV